MLKYSDESRNGVTDKINQRIYNAMAQNLEVVSAARHWRMHDAAGTVTPEAYERARSWLLRVGQEGSYAVSIVMPFRWDDQDGLLSMSSTAESCSIDNANKKHDGLRQITMPGWMKYRCWFHAGLVMVMYNV